MEAKSLKYGGWVFYMDMERITELETDKCGKWMCFFDSKKEGIDFAKRICKEIVLSGAAVEAKHTDEPYALMAGSGVCCFYCDGADIEAHKKIIDFMIKNELIRKTKTGKLFNISFKYDSQTHDGKYGSEFESQIKLKDFVDLETGEWLSSICI